MVKVAKQLRWYDKMVVPKTVEQDKVQIIPVHFDYVNYFDQVR